LSTYFNRKVAEDKQGFRLLRPRGQGSHHSFGNVESSPPLPENFSALVSAAFCSDYELSLLSLGAVKNSTRRNTEPKATSPKAIKRSVFIFLTSLQKNINGKKKSGYAA
jgi:hypothetical protein